MAKPRTKPKIKGRKRAKAQKFVVVSARSYGARLKGSRIYYEGSKPANLRKDGTIAFGKHILETLKLKFPKFQWIISEQIDSISTTYGIARVRTSQRLLKRMSKENWDRSRDIKNDIVQRFFSIAFPSDFVDAAHTVYVPGTLARIVSADIVPHLSGEDKDALTAFLPDFVASEASGSVNQLNAAAQIKTLKGLAADLEREIGRSHGESWWQTYIKSNILLLQHGYIKAINKMNVAIGNTKFPDFCLITHDNYLDILEIKKPDTPTLKADVGRGNYYWDAEVSKAIIQTENYIEQVSNKANDVRSYLLDNEKIDIKAVRPRGIILAGNAQAFTEQKQRDDFRLLSQGLKSVTIVTYDELLARLTNYIAVLEGFGGPPTPKK